MNHDGHTHHEDSAADEIVEEAEEVHDHEHVELHERGGEDGHRRRVDSLDEEVSIDTLHGWCCCLPTSHGPWQRGSPMFPLVVHQPASPSIWPAVQ